MPIPRVPPPGSVVCVRRQAHGSADVDVEGVQAVGGTLHLGQKTPPLIPHTQDPVLDQDLVLVLVQLPQTDDVGG
jgi:hypothetical protein